MKAHEVDFKIYGEEMQCVEIELDPNETVIAIASEKATAPSIGILLFNFQIFQQWRFYIKRN
jgi:hypothetical protein